MSKLSCFTGGAALAAAVDMFSHLVPHDYSQDTGEIVITGSMGAAYGLYVAFHAVRQWWALSALRKWWRAR